MSIIRNHKNAAKTRKIFVGNKYCGFKGESYGEEQGSI